MTSEKEKSKTLKSKFKEKLQELREVLNVLKDKEDISQKFSFLFDPKNIKTATRLSQSQVEFVADAHTAKTFYEEFNPLKILAVEVSECAISHDGLGRKDAIEYALASRPSSQVPSAIGILTQGEEKKDKKAKKGEEEKK